MSFKAPREKQPVVDNDTRGRQIIIFLAIYVVVHMGGALIKAIGAHIIGLCTYIHSKRVLCSNCSLLFHPPHCITLHTYLLHCVTKVSQFA